MRNGRRRRRVLVIAAFHGVTSELGASVLEPNLQHKKQLWTVGHIYRPVVDNKLAD